MDTKALRQKILDLAIRGKLVPQILDEEPASVLLEKIRAEKQQMVKAGKLKAKDIKKDTIIFKGEDNLHYEKFTDGTVKCIEDEIPFEVPEGWAWCRLSEIIELHSGQDLEPNRYNNNGQGIPYITGASNLENGKVIVNRWTLSPTTHSIKGDLLLTCKGSGVGKMALCNLNDAHIARQIMALRCRNCIIKEYLQIVLSALIDGIIHQANGIIPGIRREVVLNTLIPLPPYNEQKILSQKIEKIINILETIDINKNSLQIVIRQTKSKILNLAIRGKLVPQNPDDEPASVLLRYIRAGKEDLIKQGKLKRDKKESIIYRGDDNSYYEKQDNECVCIDDDIPYCVPNGWEWCTLGICCQKTIKRGKSPKYSTEGNTLVFAQKCNTKYNGIDLFLALKLEKTMLTKYSDEEFMIDKDIVINSTGTGTLGRVGIYKDSDNYNQSQIVPDSHVTVIRTHSLISSEYVYAFLKYSQPLLEKMGEGSTNQKELKPISLINLRIPIPPLEEQRRIVNKIAELLNFINSIEANLI